MSLTVSISVPTLVAVVATLGVLLWCGSAIARDERQNGGGMFPGMGALLFLPVGALGVTLVWLGRACVALWWGF